MVVTEADVPTPPCGICRQVLVEFAPDLEIVSVTTGGRQERWRLRDLLPSPFTPCVARPLMKLGRVVGTVVSTRKDPSLESLKLLVVENLTTGAGAGGGVRGGGGQRGVRGSGKWCSMRAAVRRV